MQEIYDYLKRRHLRRMEPLAALIDMDGTLYNSMDNHADAWMKVAQEEGLEARREEFFIWEGQTGADTIDLLMRRSRGRAATDEEKSVLYQRKTEYFKALPPVEPMPGAKEMLDFFISTGISRVLVTGSGQRSLIDRLSRDFPGAFLPEMMITSRDVEHGKPHPEPYIRAMQRARVRPSQAIVVENAPLGVKSGVAAGAFTVGVVTGPIPTEQFRKAEASVIYPSMRQFADELPTLVLKMLTTFLD